MMKNKLTVVLGDRSYPIYIESGLLTNADKWIDTIKKRGKVVIITNTTVQQWYLQPLKDSLVKYGISPLALILEDGEKYKNLESFDKVMTFLMEHNCGRDTTLIALGGGVIGDLTGFCAASFQRGVDFIQVPTTLLSQVDSSVGGKTGINHPLGKNMIGAFYQPKSVIIDIDCLKTLPQRELSAGMAEVIKYGIIWDKEFFDYLEEHTSQIWNLDYEVLCNVIHTCCSIKAEVVRQDEKEGGLRAILNLGHTFGHAIETFMGYGVWLHGEAVGVGMCMAAKLALMRNMITDDDFTKIKSLIKENKLPILKPENMTVQDFLSLMVHDKKNINGKIRFILPTKMGASSLFSDVTEDEIVEAIK